MITRMKQRNLISIFRLRDVRVATVHSIFRTVCLLMMMTVISSNSPTVQPFLSFSPTTSFVPSIQPTVSFQPTVSLQPTVSFVPTAAIGTSTTYGYTGSYQSVVVPQNAATMNVVAYGAGGTSITNVQTCYAGFGAKVVQTFTVVPGTTYYVYVGSASTSNAAGFNGGGPGGSSAYSQGGCGATDVRTSIGDLATRILVAGGGGGCYINIATTNGGDAGLNGYQGGTYQEHAGGFGGTQTAGGGIGNGVCQLVSAGKLGQGGTGCISEGGGGGGGYYGGGGNTYAAGGGGSSYPSSAAITDAFWTSGNGQCTITFYAAPSVSPTIVPTVVPTTIQPSVRPTTFVPTVVPTTILPTVHPTTIQPTVFPTVLPSLIPTVLPSITPTAIPSVQPISPSTFPTTIPTKTPTVLPSVSPSVCPSVLPSTSPTVVPSATPSLLPSVFPTTSPTVLPTITPTFVPSASPSALPSVSPSVLPSAIPTLIPSVVPSHSPSINPSIQPTISPSADPTVSPTLNPSTVPTIVPSVVPSTAPSLPPTLLPTLCPSVSPTVFPSVVPSTTPSMNPTIQPSISPTCVPTVIPTQLPSIVPTVSPSTIPSLVPSLLPSSFPITPTQSPTLTPTIDPTMTPSFTPSISPSITPSITPSIAPSIIPSVNPSVNPSVIPSVYPSLSPSLLPTMSPSNIPSLFPTGSPSIVPTLCPSLLPTMLPTPLPTLSPTSEPSGTPTAVPTLAPTIEKSETLSKTPSISPTMNPTMAPSETPSVAPSRNPSLMPSHPPSPQPSTTNPSIQPSVLPTCIPSSQPSQQPSSSPSTTPSSHPSSCPTCRPSQQPTAQPSLQPITEPSRRPSNQPISTPTDQPSAQPSDQPSSQPIEQPTIKPSAQPTSQPTSKPTRLPTGSPTQQPTNQPTMVPTVQPTAISTTYSQYGSLPINKSISIIGSHDAHFKIVLVAFPTISDSLSSSFTDIELSSGSAGTAKAVASNSSVNSILYNFVGVDSVRRSASVLNDVNGDGHSDLIIGDPNRAVCYVLFGTSRGLTNVNEGFSIFGESEGDLTGWSVSGAGDVNNDTLSDIIVGAPNAKGVGAFYVIFGRRMNSRDVYLSSLSTKEGFAVYGAAKDDYLGNSVSSAGDVNGDGCDDVIVAAIITSAYYAGSAYIVFGGRSVHSASSIDQLTSSQVCRLSGAAYQFVGCSVSEAGDFNRDGYNDIVIGTSPSRSSLVLSAYIVYGSPTLSDIKLSALSASQGVRFVGGGTVVSYDGGTVFIGSNIPISGSTGLIVYSSTSSLVPDTTKPSFSPTSVSLIPIVRPSLQPSIKPSQKPTRMPSTVVPSNAPMINSTASPSVSSSNEPTVEPSVEPSETPTVIPNVQPSEVPSLLPSTSPSISPTEWPSIQPSIAPSTAQPFQYAPSRMPKAVPTLYPSFVVTLPQSIEFMIEGNTAAYYNDSQSSVETRYIVNTTGNITIDPSLGKCVYVIVRSTLSLILTIERFNISSDQIDLSQFKDIQQYSDLVITAGSVIITLPMKQVIHILNHEPSDMSSRNFILSGGTVTSDRPETLATATSIAVVVVAIPLIVGVVSLFHWLYRKSKERATCVGSDREFLWTYVTDRNGEYIFKDENTNNEDNGSRVSVDLSQHSVDSSEERRMENENLSAHTIDSNGEWRYKGELSGSDQEDGEELDENELADEAAFGYRDNAPADPTDPFHEHHWHPTVDLSGANFSNQQDMHMFHDQASFDVPWFEYDHELEQDQYYHQWTTDIEANINREYFSSDNRQ